MTTSTVERHYQHIHSALWSHKQIIWDHSSSFAYNNEVFIHSKHSAPTAVFFHLQTYKSHPQTGGTAQVAEQSQAHTLLGAKTSFCCEGFAPLSLAAPETPLCRKRKKELHAVKTHPTALGLTSGRSGHRPWHQAVPHATSPRWNR